MKKVMLFGQIHWLFRNHKSECKKKHSIINPPRIYSVKQEGSKNNLTPDPTCAGALQTRNTQG